MLKKSHHRRIDFDEVVSDTISQSEFNTIEKPIRVINSYAIFGITVVFAIIFLSRITFFIGIDGDKYINKSSANIDQEIPLIAPRGIIVDKFDNPLIENVAIFSVFLRVDEMIRLGEEDAVLDAVENELGLDKEDVLELIKNTNLENYTDIILTRDVPRDKIINLRALNLSSLIVESNFERNYINTALSHLVGYVGLVDSEDLNTDKNLVLNDIIGRSGIELFYDDILRGENGAVSIFKNATGDISNIERTKEPIPGDKLETTIDLEFQEYFHNRMIQGLASLERTSGAGIAINPQNGEILALISLPSFDANNVSDYLVDKNRPLFNRTISGLYSPGSTIKPIHAIAALNENIITPEKQIFSAGYIELPNPYNPDNPSRFVDWKPHGWVDVHSALARSSNVYFYEVGGGFEDITGLGIKRLREYWKLFGLDKKTGIDLPGENSGLLPSPEKKEEQTGSFWRVGDTYNVSIGQGDLQITPIELINFISLIANNGIAYKPHIKKTEDSEELINISYLNDSIRESQIGMEDAVTKSYGTANSLNDLDVSVAAKTGSAQTTGNTKTNAFIVGYAPTDNPEIAVLVLIEDAREGSLNAVPIARDVFRWYHENRLSIDTNN